MHVGQSQVGFVVQLVRCTQGVVVGDDARCNDVEGHVRAADRVVGVVLACTQGQVLALLPLHAQLEDIQVGPAKAWSIVSTQWSTLHHLIAN